MPIRNPFAPDRRGPVGGGVNRPDTFSQDGWDWYIDDFGEPQPLGRTETDGADGGRGTSSSSSTTGQYVNDALTAAAQAIQSFLSGQSLADARKLGAAEQFQNMAAWALPAGELPGGFQEGGPMQQLAAMSGRKNYMAPSRASRRVDPGALEHPGQVPPEIMQFIDQMISAANQGSVVTTGGSVSSSS